MRVFIFRSEKDPGILAYTPDKAGANLPAALAPWQPLGGNALMTGSFSADARASDPVSLDIREHGYSIARVKD